MRDLSIGIVFRKKKKEKKSNRWFEATTGTYFPMRAVFSGALVLELLDTWWDQSEFLRKAIETV